MKYIVRVNCPGFEDIEVEAKSIHEATEIAKKRFNCDGSDVGEVESFREVEE